MGGGGAKPTHNHGRRKKPWDPAPEGRRGGSGGGGGGGVIAPLHRTVAAIRHTLTDFVHDDVHRIVLLVRKSGLDAVDLLRLGLAGPRGGRQQQEEGRRREEEGVGADHGGG